jgi:hypothetical protein
MIYAQRQFYKPISDSTKPPWRQSYLPPQNRVPPYTYTDLNHGRFIRRIFRPKLITLWNGKRTWAFEPKESLAASRTLRLNYLKRILPLTLLRQTAECSKPLDKKWSRALPVVTRNRGTIFGQRELQPIKTRVWPRLPLPLIGSLL